MKYLKILGSSDIDLGIDTSEPSFFKGLFPILVECMLYYAIFKRGKKKGIIECRIGVFIL